MVELTGYRIAVLLNFLFTTVIYAVKITKVSIPDYYVIEKSNESSNVLVLDCEYELNSDERGLVIQWRFEDEIVYQWIPHGKPFITRPYMKGKIDTAYKISSEPLHQYRALALIDPTWNSTGKYSCHADTFESSDRKSKYLQVIDKSKGTIEICRNKVNDKEEISCVTTHFFPQPIVNLTLNDEPIPKRADKFHLRTDGLFDVTAIASTPLLDAETDGQITCHVYFPKTNYTIEKIMLLSGARKIISTSLILITSIASHLAINIY